MVLGRHRYGAAAWILRRGRDRPGKTACSWRTTHEHLFKSEQGPGVGSSTNWRSSFLKKSWFRQPCGSSWSDWPCWDMNWKMKSFRSYYILHWQNSRDKTSENISAQSKLRAGPQLARAASFSEASTCMAKAYAAPCVSFHHWSQIQAMFSMLEKEKRWHQTNHHLNQQPWLPFSAGIEVPSPQFCEPALGLHWAAWGWQSNLHWVA